MPSTVKRDRTRRAVKKRKPPLALHILIYPDDGWMLGHNLETDIVSQGETADEALRMVLEAVELTFETVQGDADAASPFESPAPTSFWKALKAADLTSTSARTIGGLGQAMVLAYSLDEAPEA